MIFTTSERIDNWMQKHQEKCKSKGAAGEQFVFKFLPTGIIECQTIKCMICGQKLTVYEG